MAKRRGVITPRDVRALGLAPENLNRLVKQGRLIRVGRGVYEHPNFEFTEMHSYVEVARVVPDAVFCLLTALRIHDIGTQNDSQVWIAIPRRRRVPRDRVVQLRVVRVSPDQFENDIEALEVEGVKIRVYSLERTIVDCFRMRHLIGLDVGLEALRESLRSRRTTVHGLMEVATRLRTWRTIGPYIEAYVA
jgi:predicted transcriptional regulator of viral defense system